MLEKIEDEGEIVNERKAAPSFNRVYFLNFLAIKKINALIDNFKANHYYNDIET